MNDKFDKRLNALEQILRASLEPEAIEELIAQYKLPTDHEDISKMNDTYFKAQNLANLLSNDSDIDNMSDEDYDNWQTGYGKTKNTLAKILSGNDSDDYFTDDDIDSSVYDAFKDSKDDLLNNYDYLIYGDASKNIDNTSDTDTNNDTNIGLDLNGDGQEDISTDLDNDGTKDIGLDIDGDGEDDTDGVLDGDNDLSKDSKDSEDFDNKSNKDDTMKNIIGTLSDRKF